MKLAKMGFSLYYDEIRRFFRYENRAIKSRGSVTRGRGLHKNVRETWLNTFTECAGIRSAMSHIRGTERSTPEHV